ncbi:class I SAM-dependent RNA methyltransferase [Elioraea sp.]|uniref:class I SAM-dependent RNA methyltransferase n=1 Tax=Elioraea sp. TaxID=2185103 RepID=UPI0021DBFE09|nr:class I SAM-dependent RNA methyltransferase [Elioraea sp.]GIX08354.1 MAG: 23S rRNA methyltransferase [Elioraea sp.]
MRRTTPRAARDTPLETTVARLGAAGDGIAPLPDGRPAYIPFALPGERVRIAPGARRGDGVAARLVARLSDSPDRADPPCPHFGACGGCSVQHLAAAAYRRWKTGLLAEALGRAGFEGTPIAPLVPAAPATRRRAELALRGRIVGFHERAARRALDVPQCRVLDPAILALADRLRGLALAALRPEAEAQVNLLDTGADLVLRGPREPDLAERERLAAFAAEADLARLSWATGEAAPLPVVVRRAPRIAFAGVAVEPPPGAFLQATRQGEAAIAAAVLDALADLAEDAAVADLYAGIGTLTFRLARRFRVRAAEGDAAAAAALRRAANAGGLAPRLAVEPRDLAARPLLPAELKGTDAVVLDPPRDGARAQCAALAEAPVRRIVYVSCNPAALARDARILAGGGWRPLRATPIDQFLWSGHLECVVPFSR